MTVEILPAGYDFTDADVNHAQVPHDEFRALRQHSPVHWVEQVVGARSGFAEESGTGYWALTKHADVSAVSKDSKNFGTFENGAIIRFGEGMVREQIELQRVMLINQDAPDHTAMRQIVSRGFTPRSINALDEVMTSRAHQIVRDAVATGSGNFVEQIAAELPLQAISELLGVPQEDRFKLFDWSNQMLASDDPDVGGDPEVASAEILGYAMMMAADRKANPRDDIVTKLVHAGESGRGLNDDEFGFFVIILTVAGNETTRNAITHGMNAFLDNPDQWELWKRERPVTMVDEVVRWATPVISFQRTAHHDVEVGGQLIKKGQRVGLFYSSANFDEDVFVDPFRFDIERTPNDHVAFGFGSHFCLGNSLARLELRVMFEQLLTRLPDLELVSPDEPSYRAANFVSGYESMPVRFTPAATVG